MHMKYHAYYQARTGDGADLVGEEGRDLLGGHEGVAGRHGAQRDDLLWCGVGWWLGWEQARESMSIEHGPSERITKRGLRTPSWWDQAAWLGNMSRVFSCWGRGRKI